MRFIVNMQSLLSNNAFLITVAIIFAVVIVAAFILVSKLIISKSINSLKFKDLQIDFTNYTQVKQNGENESLERFRSLLLKQLLFTQEFVNRFQPLISTFVSVAKSWDEKTLTTDDRVIKYPSLKYIDESLKRFRDLIRNTQFNYVINWDNPIYDKVNSGYRKYFIENLGNNIKNMNLANPNILDDCKKQLPTIDIEDLPFILKDFPKILNSIENIINKNFEIILSDVKASAQINDTDITLLKSYLDKLQNYVSILDERETSESLRYDYAMDVANSMYESLLYWNERSPIVLQTETQSILYIIYQNLSLWLIRNDLPLSLMKLEQYLNTHTQNLVSKINEETIKQFPRFSDKMWEESLSKMKISDINIGNYFKESLREWITGVQQIRFGTNIFLGMNDFKQ